MHAFSYVNNLQETQEIRVCSFQYEGRRVHLIDTPGFDDTYRTDSVVLRDLAY
jgi:peptide subunit release factor RF-3